MDSLIFIDTNIFLDFYEYSAKGIILKLLKKLQDNKESLIITDQVVMEFKKKRQKIIKKYYEQLKAPVFNGIIWREFLSTSSDEKEFSVCKKEISRLYKKLKAEIEKAIREPAKSDLVFIETEKIFSPPGPNYIGKDHANYANIKKRSLERYQLGFPPRKEKDTSCGDAINWECIIECALASKKNIIIVSRDSDYGTEIEGKAVLNNWLQTEFLERVGKKTQIRLEKTLSSALRALNITITKKEEAGEKLTAASFLNIPLEDRFTMRDLAKAYLNTVIDANDDDEIIDIVRKRFKFSE